jgi:hypothetical protein
MIKTRVLLGFAILTMACGGTPPPSEESLASGVGSASTGETGEDGLSQASQSLTNVKVIQNCSAFGYNEASCDAYCPAGYLATGGGCRAENFYWELRASHPTPFGEGWRCTANEDFKSTVYNQNVTGWVVCIQM